MNLKAWARKTSGFDGWWEALQFDRAVSWFGRYVEARLSETDSQGNYLYTLEDMLADAPPDRAVGLHQLMRQLGVIRK